MTTETARSIMEGSDPCLQGVSGSYRFEVESVGNWRIELSDGIVSITESTAPADCVIRFDEEDFVRIARGEQNPLIAFLQCRVQGGEGDTPSPSGFTASFAWRVTGSLRRGRWTPSAAAG